MLTEVKFASRFIGRQSRVMILGLAGLLPATLIADGAAPYGYDCLKSIHQWDQVAGTWLMRSGTLQSAGSDADRVAVFQELSPVLSKWYRIELVASGLTRAPDKTFGVIVGYTDPKNYVLCTFIQSSATQAKITLSQIVAGHESIISAVEYDQPEHDSVSLVVGLYLLEKFRVSVGPAGREPVLQHVFSDKLPNSFGFHLKTNSITFSRCVVYGTAKS